MASTLEGVWRGIVSAISDTLFEVSGHLMVRISAAHTAGDTTLAVEGTHRWPTVGRIIVDGVSHYYTGKTATTLTGLVHHDADHGVALTITLEDGTTRKIKSVSGLAADLRDQTVVMLYTRDQSDMDLLRKSFFLETAEGVDLDTYARNYGLFRVRGMPDTMFRELLLVLVYLDATTMYSIEKVLDVLKGAGNYDLYEKDDDIRRVFVDIPPSYSSVSKGKAYMAAQEVCATTTPLTVSLVGTPVEVYGIYDATDVTRTGANYLLSPLTVWSNGNETVTSGLAFVTTDVGKPIFRVGTDEHWKILGVLDPSNAILGRDNQSGGSLNTGTPHLLEASTDYFRPWMAGHKVQIVSSSRPSNHQIADIVGVPTDRSVVLNNAVPFQTDINVEYRLIPYFPLTTPSFGVRLMRHTVAGSNITTVATMPASVSVDYTTVSSMQLVSDQNTDGNDREPFYLFDDTYIIKTVLDIITAAGVEAVVEVTT